MHSVEMLKLCKTHWNIYIKNNNKSVRDSEIFVMKFSDYKQKKKEKEKNVILSMHKENTNYRIKLGKRIIITDNAVYRRMNV